MNVERVSMTAASKRIGQLLWQLRQGTVILLTSHGRPVAELKLPEPKTLLEAGNQ